MIELVYLNNNISKVEADKLVSEGQETRKGLYDKLLSNMESLETDKQRASYLAACLPVICMI